MPRFVCTAEHSLGTNGFVAGVVAAAQMMRIRVARLPAGFSLCTPHWLRTVGCKIFADAESSTECT